jgi:hypothetical protein
MGYLLKIFYHPKIDDKEFKFDTDIKKEKTYKIGKKEENIEASKLASVIMQQLSRRDILVCDIEVEQFVKKTIKVRETKNGIIIGNEKFTFNDSLLQENKNIEIEDLDKNMNVIQNNNLFIPNNIKEDFIKEEYFEPDPLQIHLKDKFKLSGLTIGKKYKIVKEIGPSKDMITHYMIINDFNKTLSVPISNFSAVPYVEQKEEESISTDIELGYPGEVKGSMIDLRPGLNQRKIT